MEKEGLGCDRNGAALTVGCRFRRFQRLGRRRDFARVFDRRCSAADSRLVVYVDANGLTNSRLGLSVGKRVGGAVARHRIKRLIREAFRLSQHELGGGLDIVCVVKPTDCNPWASGRMDDYRGSLVRLTESAHRKLRRSQARVEGSS